MGKTIKTTSLDWYHNDFTIPAWGWDENVYVDYKGAVRAMRFLKIEFTVTFANDGYSHLRTPPPVYHVKMAGIGELALNGDHINRFPLKYLLNTEGFSNPIGVIKKEWMQLRKEDVRYVTTEWMSQCFGVNRQGLATMQQLHIHDGQAMKLVRYVWDGVKPVPVPMTIPEKVYYTPQVGWFFAEPCKLPEGSYATYVECKQASETKVVEFEDEPEQPVEYHDIMDVYNAHRAELVKKINAAWKSAEHHDRFAPILFAIGCRDKDEILEKFDVAIRSDEDAMDNAHEILEGVCDDWDLETILGFVRYEENND